MEGAADVWRSSHRCTLQVMPPNLHPTWGYLPDPPIPTGSHDAHQPTSLPASLQASPIKAPAGPASPPGRPSGWAAADSAPARQQPPEQASPERAAAGSPRAGGEAAAQGSAAIQEGEAVANGDAGATHRSADADGISPPAQPSMEGGAEGDHAGAQHVGTQEGAEAAAASLEPDSAAEQGEPFTAADGEERPAQLEPDAALAADQQGDRQSGATELPGEEGFRPESGGVGDAGVPGADAADQDAPDQEQALQLDKRSEGAALAAAHHEAPDQEQALQLDKRSEGAALADAPDQDGPSADEPDQEQALQLDERSEGAALAAAPDQDGPSADAPDQEQPLQLDKRSEGAALAAAHHEAPPLAPGQPCIPSPPEDCSGAAAVVDSTPAVQSAAGEVLARDPAVDDQPAAERGAPEAAPAGSFEVTRPGPEEQAPAQAAVGRSSMARQWLLFNDFAVGPTGAAEVTQLYGLQKIPCLVVYTQARAGSPPPSCACATTPMRTWATHALHSACAPPGLSTTGNILIALSLLRRWFWAITVCAKGPTAVFLSACQVDSIEAASRAPPPRPAPVLSFEAFRALCATPPLQVPPCL